MSDPYGLPARTHHTALTTAKATARNVGKFLANNAAVVLFGLDLLYSRYERRKAAKAAREAAADAATIDVSAVPTDAAADLPVVVGRAVVRGLSAYAATGQRAPWLPRLAATTSDGEALGQLAYYTSSGALRDAAHHANDRFDFLLLQDMLARHDVDSIRHATVDGEDIEDFPVVVELGAAGTASDMASRFDAGHGDAHGNGLGERTSASDFPLGAFATAIAWNDVLGEPKYRRTPALSYQLLGARMPGVAEAAGVYSETAVAYSNLAPLVLLWAYRAPWGLGGAASQATLKSVHAALTRAEAVMQGRGGLDAQAYPPILNSIEGTAYGTYADAFADRGYITFNTLKRTRSDLAALADAAGWETGWPSPAGGGGGRGDRFPRVHPAYGSRLVGTDDQAWTIKRGEANGTLFPGADRASLFVEIMQTMPFASFARQLGSGERELRWPDLSGAVPDADYELGESDVLGFSVEPPSDPPTNARVDYSDSAHGGVAETHTLFDESRAGASTHAADYFAARFGARSNTLRIAAALVDNQAAAAHVGWCAMSERLAERVAIERNCSAGFSDVGDVVALSIPSRGVSLKVLLLSTRLDVDGFTQSLGGIALADHMAAWPVARRRGTEEPGEEPPRPDQLPETICAAWRDDEQVVAIDFDCDEDDDGNPVAVPRFPDGCDDERVFRIGDGAGVPLPIYGPGDAAYGVTGADANIVYDAANHELDIADATPAGSYPIAVTGTIGANTATCRFTLRVVAATAAFAVAVECSPVGVVTCSREGGAWRVRLPRSRRRFSLRARLRDLAGDGLPASATVTFTSPRANDRVQTVPRAADGSIVSAWNLFDEFTDFTVNLEALIECEVAAGGETRTEQIVATRPRG